MDIMVNPWYGAEEKSAFRLHFYTGTKFGISIPPLFINIGELGVQFA